VAKLLLLCLQEVALCSARTPHATLPAILQAQRGRFQFKTIELHQKPLNDNTDELMADGN